MIPLKAGKQVFSLITGKITTDSYKQSIKKVTLASNEEKVFVQLIPKRIVAGERHILAAIDQSNLISHKNGKISKNAKNKKTKNPRIEFLTCLLGERQINRAIEKAEFGDEEMFLLIGFGDKKKVKRIIEKLNFSESKGKVGGKINYASKAELIKTFGISETALKTLSDLENPIEELVLEKIATGK